MVSKSLQFSTFYLADVWMYHGKLPVCAAVTSSAITRIMALALKLISSHSEVKMFSE